MSSKQKVLKIGNGSLINEILPRDMIFCYNCKKISLFQKSQNDFKCSICLAQQPEYNKLSGKQVLSTPCKEEGCKQRAFCDEDITGYCEQCLLYKQKIQREIQRKIEREREMQMIRERQRQRIQEIELQQINRQNDIILQFPLLDQATYSDIQGLQNNKCSIFTLCLLTILSLLLIIAVIYILIYFPENSFLYIMLFIGTYFGLILLILYIYSLVQIFLIQ